MPGPTLRPSGVFQLNVRVPADLLKVVAGTPISLPVGGALATVRASDKVMLSLRTMDQREARARFTIAHGVLLGHFGALRRGAVAPARDAAAESRPEPETDPGPLSGTRLTHKQIVALAGDVYREHFDRNEEEFDLDAIAGAHSQHERSVRAWMVGDADDTPISRDDAEFLAILSEPYGPQCLAWQRRAEVVSPCLREPMTLEQALEDLFGRHADEVCAKHGLRLHPETRARLLAQIADTVELGAGRLQRVASGDYSADSNLARFPTFDAATRVTVTTLFERWCESNRTRVEASTIRRYTPSLASLGKFLGDKDVRRVSQDDIWDWAERRRDGDGIAASTVNRNDLVAASAVFSFAKTRDGKRLRPDNPVDGVKLVVPKTVRQRLPFFKPAEVSAILKLARAARPRRGYPKATASRR